MISGTTLLYQARPISNDRIGQAGFKNRLAVQNKGHAAAYGLLKVRSQKVKQSDGINQNDGKEAAERFRIGSESMSGEGIREDLFGDGLYLSAITQRGAGARK